MGKSVKKLIPLCNNKINKHCLYTSSVSQLSSFIAVIISIGIIAWGLIYKDNQLFPFNSQNSLNNSFILILKIATLIFIIPHSLRIFLSMSKMDNDVDYCYKFIRFLTNSQKVFDWAIRVLITITLLCFLTLNSLVSQIIIIKFFFWPLLIYSLLLFWDTIMFSFVLYLKTKKVQIENDYKKVRLSFFLVDFFGFVLYCYLFHIEGMKLVDEKYILAIAIILLIIAFTCFLYLFYDILRNYKGYFKILFPILKCTDK